MSVIKKAIFAGIGAATLTREKLKAIADELVQKGQTSETEEARFMRDCITKVEGKIQQARQKMKPKWKIEIDTLNAKLDRLTAEVEKLSKARAK